jgi:hypothetical protein
MKHKGLRIGFHGFIGSAWHGFYNIKHIMACLSQEFTNRPIDVFIRQQFHVACPGVG